MRHKILTLLRGKFKTIKCSDLVFIGSEYGGWTIPQSSLSEGSICYAGGAGEDISFDVVLAERYKCQVYIFDPTPRSKSHFNELIESTNLNKKFAINNSKTNFYSLNYRNIELLNFRELGLWYKKEEIKFYSPPTAEEVSHSALNEHKRSEKVNFIGKVNRLSKIMEDEGHQHIDLLKLDIEGSEYYVIDSIIKDNVKIKTICVEFHEPHKLVDRIFQLKTKQYIKKLSAFGYSLVYYDDRHNFTFVKNSF